MTKHSRKATLRLQKDYQRLLQEPVPYIEAKPEDSNILNWHYVFTGPPESPYHGGIYHGMLKFPDDYPFKPPSIFIFTPNGRFELGKRICLSMSDYHPDSWNPAWCVSTILTGLLSFMLEESDTEGSIVTSDKIKRILATRSLSFNLKDEKFTSLFPQYEHVAHDVKNSEIKENQPTHTEKDSPIKEQNTLIFKNFQYVDRYCTLGLLFVVFSALATYIVLNAD